MFVIKSGVMRMKLSIVLLFFSATSLAIFNCTINDSAFNTSVTLMDNTYHKYCKNSYSQNGEDGLLEQLIKELNIDKGTFCEFGAYDGISSSNTYNLIINHGFSGVAIEPNSQCYELCKNNYASYPNVEVWQGMVIYNDNENKLDAWLDKSSLPWDFDILSIDIDGDDYFVWEGLKKYTPKIVIIETNSYRDPIVDELPGQPSQQYNIDPLAHWHPDRIACGCSFISAVKLGLNKGYIPVAYTGNITFVRKDLVHLLKDFPYVISDNPYDYIHLYSAFVLWGNKWMTNTGLILNVAIRNYFLKFGEKSINTNWLNNEIDSLIKKLKIS